MPTNGFRGPARRAAFGDVTNVARNAGIVPDEGKLIKVQPSTFVPQVQPSSLINKENVPLNNKEAFSRPVQRGSVLWNKVQSVVTNRSSDAPWKPARDSFPKSVAVTTTSQAQYVQPAIEPPQDSQISSEWKDGVAAVPLQPRHHKSQPQLKIHQPTLRRTQSRLLEKPESAPDASSIYSAVLLSEHASVNNPSGHDATDPNVLLLHAPTAEELPVELSHGDQYDAVYSEVQLKLPEIYEEAPALAGPYKEGSAPALSEPEEYWDEEDYEEYDDQDQAYTTAHSFRSRDLTSGGPTTLLAPRVTTRVQRELEEAKMVVEQNRGQEEVEDEAWDVSMVAEYGEEIFEYLRQLEVGVLEFPFTSCLLTNNDAQSTMLPNPHYMDIQTEIQWSMRSVLMDWLVQVHSRFSLLPETLFLTVNYIDRFLSSKVVSIGKLQLVGATAILIASKYEEINCPSLQEIVYMVDRGYSMEEILKAERFMLSMLGFELGWPGPMSFLRRVSKADDYDLETRTLAKYFLELTIMDERFVASPPSFLAAGAHCLARLILKKGDWVSSS